MPENLTTTEFFNLSATERVAACRALGWHTHQGPDDWRHDLATSNDRALQVITAIHHGLPRPLFGRRRGEPKNA